MDPQSTPLPSAGGDQHTDPSLDNNTPRPAPAASQQGYSPQPPQQVVFSPNPQASVSGPAPSGMPATPSGPTWQNTGIPAPAASMPASVVGGPRKTHKGLLIGLFVGLTVLLLGGASAAAYYGYVVPNKPENVLKAALVNSFSADKVQSEHFSGRMSFKEKTSDMNIGASFTGGANNSGAMEIKADIDAVVTKITLDARSIDGQTIYLKVGGLDGLPELLSGLGGSEAAAYAPIIDGLNEQWIEINQSILSQLGLGSASIKVSQADRDKLAQVYAQHQFLSAKEKLKDEVISNMASYHYKVVVNKDEFKAFLAGLKDANIESLKITQAQLDSMNDALKNADFTKYPVDMWIAKSNKLVDQVSFTLSDNESSIDLRFTVTDFNKPVTVTKPSGAKSLLEVMSQLMSGNSNSSTLLQGLEDGGISL